LLSKIVQFYFLQSPLKNKKMKKSIFRAIVLPLTATLLVTACKKDDATTTNNNPNVQLLQSATLGNYLATKDNKALYFFANDADGISTCTGSCEASWPAYTTTDVNTLTLGTNLLKTDFSTIITPSGKTQVTYKGWPLYTYSPAQAGGYGGTTNQPEADNVTTGDGRGGVWFVAKPDYTIMLANHQLRGNDGNLYTSQYAIGTGLTNHFTDAQGRSLYVFTNDSFNINKFTKPDYSNNATWPLYEQDKIVVPSTLDKAMFGSINIFGKKQLTYKGWPIYYFGADGTQRGASKGVSVPAAGRWPVVVKDIAEAKR
jgi:predicted lipoprotein with Yx(FWY)xxD motif